MEFNDHGIFFVTRNEKFFQYDIYIKALEVANRIVIKTRQLVMHSVSGITISRLLLTIVDPLMLCVQLTCYGSRIFKKLEDSFKYVLLFCGHQVLKCVVNYYNKDSSVSSAIAKFKMEFFMAEVNDQKPLTFVTKISNLNLTVVLDTPLIELHPPLNIGIYQFVFFKKLSKKLMYLKRF